MKNKVEVLKFDVLNKNGRIYKYDDNMKKTIEEINKNGLTVCEDIPEELFPEPSKICGKCCDFEFVNNSLWCSFQLIDNVSGQNIKTLLDNDIKLYATTVGQGDIDVETNIVKDYTITCIGLTSNPSFDLKPIKI